jgi:hypothetical protein
VRGGGKVALALLHNFHIEMKACLLLDLGLAIIMSADAVEGRA